MNRMSGIWPFLFCLPLLVLCCPFVRCEGRLSDLMARFSSDGDSTTKGPTGLDSLLTGGEYDRESTHSKSWKKLDGHRHRDLSSLMDDYYPEMSTEGPHHHHHHRDHRHRDEDRHRDHHERHDNYRSDIDDDDEDSLFKVDDDDDINSDDVTEPITTLGPINRHNHHSRLNGRHSDDADRTTPGPVLSETSGRSVERSWSEDDRKLPMPDIPTRHHHRYHRGDVSGPHQPQADSSFSQPSVSGYYDYSSSSSGNSPAKVTRLSSIDWRKNIRTRSRWSTSNRNNGVVIGSLPRSEVDKEASAHRQASLHVKAAREMACRIPQAKIIRVSDHYPSADKMYFPSCTRLHQCAQDTGCCPASRRCGPKATQRIELYFFSSSMRSGGEGSSPIQVEKLPFFNHTECECQDRNDEMPRDKEQLSSNSIDSVDTLETINRNVCLCPSEFTLKFLPNGTCACDCFDKQKECTKYKRGKEFFNHKDKLCIALNKCVLPMCDYGSYNRRYGRCPRKHERHKTPWSSKYN